MTGGRGPALVAFLLLGLVLAGVIVATTPWQPLPGDVPGGRTAPSARADFTEAEHEREDAFHRDLRPSAYAGLAVGLLVAGLLALTPLGARLVGALPGPWFARAALAGVVLSLLPSLAVTPLAMRSERVLRRYRLSTQDWGGWFADRAKGWAIAAVLAALTVVVLVGIGRRAAAWWWAWSGVAAAALVVVVSFAYPVVIEPLFNRFTPLPAGQLRTTLLDLAERDGVPVREVLVADASRRTTALNAYVSGIGATRRIVVYDTLVERGTPAEVELVVAHELGHVVHRDVLHGTLIGALGAIVAMTLVHLAATSPALLRRAGADGIGDPKVAALLLFSFAVLTQLSSPVQQLVSRRVETRADVHSLELTRDPETFVAGERTLAVTNLSDLDPNRLVYLMFYSHPTAPERIAVARDWAKLAGVPVPSPRAGQP